MKNITQNISILTFIISVATAMLLAMSQIVAPRFATSIERECAIMVLVTLTICTTSAMTTSILELAQRTSITRKKVD